MANDVGHVDENDPLVRLIRKRHPDLSNERVLVLKQEWWSLYHEGFRFLGAIAADTVQHIDEKSPLAAMYYFARRLEVLLPFKSTGRAYATFKEEIDASVREHSVRCAGSTAKTASVKATSATPTCSTRSVRFLGRAPIAERTASDKRWL